MNYCYQVPESVLPKAERIIVVGDIHGDFKALRRALRRAGLINRERKWIGGRTHLVQIGDLLDRGGRNASVTDERSERKILDFLFTLHAQAIAVNGNVHILLGNHELMNVAGNFRYVSPMGMTDFGGDRREILSGGEMAQKLACHSNSIVKIGSWLFSHAGVVPNLAEGSPAEKIKTVNEKVRNYLLGNTQLSQDDEVMDIFWNRDYSSGNANCAKMSRTLAEYDSKYMAVGHTVQYNGINSQCNSKLWRVDVGMSEAFGKPDTRKCQVLEIMNDGERITVI